MQSSVGMNWNLSDGLNFVKRHWENVRFFKEHTDGSNPDAAATATTTDNQPFNLISNFESQLIEFQSLLIWEKPANSILALICFSCLYWIVVLWDPHLLSMIATLAFCYHFYEMWTRYIWPEISVPSAVIKEKWTSINPKVLSAPEIQLLFGRVKVFILELFSKIIEFRRKFHGIFCCFTILFFACFLYIGHFIPGILITYCTAIILFLTPGFLAHIVPKNTFDVFIERHNNNSNGKKDHQHQPSVQPPSRPLSALFSPDAESESRMTSTLTMEAKESNDDYGDDDDGDGEDDNDVMLTTHENHFRKTPESTSSSDTDSDFVLISESELLNL